MKNDDPVLAGLMAQRELIRARLGALPWAGQPEIKTRSGKRYLYTRKRVDGHLRSTYIGPYSDELFRALKENGGEEHRLRIELRRLDKRISKRVSSDADSPSAAGLSLLLAKARKNELIADELALSEAGIPRSKILALLENGTLTGLTPDQIGVVMTLSRAWDAVLELKDPAGLDFLFRLSRLFNGRENSGLRTAVFSSTGTGYVPPPPDEQTVRERLERIGSSKAAPGEIAAALCLYLMRTQAFNAENELIAMLYANRVLIALGGGIFDIPEKDLPAFRELRAAFYNGTDNGEIMRFLTERCVIAG